jgi:hypothetical protein
MTKHGDTLTSNRRLRLEGVFALESTIGLPSAIRGSAGQDTGDTITCRVIKSETRLCVQGS